MVEISGAYLPTATDVIMKEADVVRTAAKATHNTTNATRNTIRRGSHQLRMPPLLLLLLFPAHLLR